MAGGFLGVRNDKNEMISRFEARCRCLDQNIKVRLGDFMDDTKRSELKRIKHQFEQGKKANKLMDDMECTFDIPLLYDKDYSNRNKEVMTLYREISESRNF